MAWTSGQAFEDMMTQLLLDEAMTLGPIQTDWLVSLTGV